MNAVTISSTHRLEGSGINHSRAIDNSSNAGSANLSGFAVFVTSQSVDGGSFDREYNEPLLL